jgi:quinoprotein glucose dehydrogenase
MHRSGLAVTGGGLVLGACWGDGTVRAYDKETGKVLWEFPLEANPEGMIAVYQVNGRQYIALCASGSADDNEDPGRLIDSLPGKASAQGYYVFALPQ